MSAAVTRDLKVTYAGVVIGSTSDYLVDGAFMLQLTPTSGRFECEVLLALDTESAFQSAEATLVTAWRTPRQRLRIEIGSAERYDFDPSDSTGFDHAPDVEKVQNEEATGTSARYKLKVTWGIQATLVNSDGRAESTTEIAVDASGIRTVRFSGLYTAVSTSSAYTQYTTNGDTFVSTYLAALLPGIQTEILTNTSSMTDSLKGCRFERVYREVIAYESTGTLNVAHLRDQRLTVSVSDVGGEDSESGARRPQDISVSYSVAVDKATTTDLVTLWTGTIYPHLLAQARAVAATGSVAIMSVDPVYDKPNNRLAATLQVRAFVGSTLEVEIEVEDQIDHGLTDVPVWDDVPFSRDVYGGPQSHTRIITTYRLSRQSTASGGSAGGGGGLNLGLGGTLFTGPRSTDHPADGNFIERTNMSRRRVMHVGLANKVKLLATHEQRVFTRAEKPSA